MTERKGRQGTCWSPAAPGYIGAHVVRQLDEADYGVVVYDNLSTGLREAVLGGELVVGDLADGSRLAEVFAARKFSAVLHFAASIVVPESVADPLAYYANNTANTLGLLRCCQMFGVEHFVFSSTAAVYGQPDRSVVDETTPTVPINLYGSSKLMDEWILRDYDAASSFRYVVLRYFNAAGADPAGRIGHSFPGATHLIKVCCEAVLGKRPEVTVFGTDYPTPDGTGVRDYIHVEDLAAAHLDALRYLEANGDSQVLNCGYGAGYSVRQVIDRVRAAAGADLTVIEGPRRAGDPASLIADASRLRDVLEWRPRHDDLDLIVTTALAWERKLP